MRGRKTVAQRTGAVCTALAAKPGQASSDDCSVVLPLFFFCIANLVGEQESKFTIASFQSWRMSTDKCQSRL